jgi:predicted Zn-dependent protease
MSAKISLVTILTMAAAGTVSLWPAQADERRGGQTILRAEGDEPQLPAREETKPEEKKDPNDVRNALDNLGMVREMKKLSKPVPGGLWQEYVNQPYFTPVQKAERLAFHGQYEDAAKAYKALIKNLKSDAKPEEKEALTIGLMGAILNQGHESDVEKFEEMYAAASPEMKKNPKVVSLKAQALLEQGKAPEALAMLKEFSSGIKDLRPLNGDVLHVLNQYGELLERSANYIAARANYQRITELEKDELPKDAQIQTEIIQAVYREGFLTANKSRKDYALKRLARIFEDDPTYWPAYLISGRILLESHNDREGGARLADVMSRNPNNLDALFFSFDHAVESYGFERAEAVLDELKERTETARVYACEGRLLLKKRTPEKALEPLLLAVKKDPTLPEARGWLAATYFLLNDRAKAQEQINALKVEDRPNPVTVFEAGEVLRDARQFADAQQLYEIAKKTTSWWSEPSAALAQLYLEIGNEKAARDEYNLSFAIDPSNIRALNQLRLLEEFMKGFKSFNSTNFLDAERKMPRFIIKCAPEDEILAKLTLEWMEKIYPEVTSYFKHQPPVPTIIEYFPNHDQFGVRTTGLPWIGTVGASTGNVIAMDVPRGQAKNMMGTFDWARVLRHEYTHTVTLSMTNNRVPHWLTEAAACEQELSPRDWDNCQLLASNYRSGTLFTLDTLTWGFIRPKRSIDRRLAYMQSQWVYQYLVETYGQPKMLEFFAAFRDGKTELNAYKDVYGKPTEELNKDFMAWAGKQIETWGLPSEKLPKRTDLEKKITDDTDKKDAKSRYELAWILANQPQGLARAKTLLEEAAKIEPSNTKIRELLGAILNGMKKTAEAKEMLTKVVEEDDTRVVAVRTLGLIAMSEKKFADAEKWFTKLQSLRPAEDTSYVKLAGIYLLNKQPEKAIPQFAELQAHEQRDEIIPRQLASLYRQQGQLAEAQDSAYRAVRINPYNALNHHLLAQIYLAENAKATNPEQKLEFAKKAAEYWGYATELQPKIADFWAGLAEANAACGDADAASDAAKKAVEIQANSPARKWIKQ